MSQQKSENMTISVQSSMNHVSPKKEESTATLKDVFVELLKERGEYDTNNITWNSDDEVVVSKINHFTLHQLVLKAEELGKQISFEKNTVIKFS